MGINLLRDYQILLEKELLIFILFIIFLFQICRLCSRI